MDKIKSSVTILLLICIPIVMNAQGGVQTPVKIIAFAKNGEIRVRWVFSDYESWNLANQQGYLLERYTTSANGQNLDATAMLNSRVTLLNGATPLTASQWDQQYSNNPFAEVAKGTLYEADISVTLSNDPTMADALNAQESQEARLVFGMFAAEQDYNVALDMQLGYQDAAVSTGHSYLYKVSVLNNNTITSGVNIHIDSLITLPEVTELSASGADKAIFVEWNIEEVQDYYSAYDVERKDPGGSFTKINDLPFIFASDSEEDPRYAVFKDEVPSNDIVYEYRIIGRTAFGYMGPSSQVITGKGKPPRMNLLVNLEEESVTENEVVVNWNEFDSQHESALQGFNLYRSIRPDRDFQKINSSYIVASTRSYTDSNPLDIAYYRLEAVDNNDYTYQSSGILVQLPDSIPPAPPTGLNGKFVTSDKAELQWTANTESDLKGYRILSANKRNGNYVQVSNYAITNTKFIHEINPEFIVDSIYYQVIATDHRDNYSTPSVSFAIKRPDKIGPSNPVLYKASPTPGGVEIGWRFSSSKDIAHHELQRKIKEGADWESVITILKSEEDQYAEDLSPGTTTSTCFIDSVILDRREYEYRFLAYDNSGNNSSSEIITIKPYDSGKRGEIEDFMLSLAEIPIEGTPTDPDHILLNTVLAHYESTGEVTNNQLLQIRSEDIITGGEYFYYRYYTNSDQRASFLYQRRSELFGATTVVHEVDLIWTYQSTEQLQDFQLYRSAEGSDIMLYKTLPIDELTSYTFNDKDVKKGARYIYQIMARHQGGGFSPMSKPVMVKVE